LFVADKNRQWRFLTVSRL